VSILVSVERRDNRRVNPEIEIVLDEFRPKMLICTRYNQPHSWVGNTSNVLSAYREAAETPGVEHVFLIEEDIMVGENFFRWHYAVQKQGDWMCSIAAINRRAKHADSIDPAEYFTSRDTYQSWGVCWPVAKLAPILEHAKPEYYSNLFGYVGKRFPNSSLGMMWPEQDGLIERVLIETHGVTAWPYVPRAFQAGAYGYHRSTKPLPGDLESRIAMLGYLIHRDPESLARMSVEFHDVDPCYLGPFADVEPRLRENL
jgi:hypothetical protein